LFVTNADTIHLLERIALYAVVIIECGIIVWAITHLRKLFVNAERSALTDSLTHLRNHRAFHEDSEREQARSRRYRNPLTLALIDIDDFKGTNDRSGHRYGDEILVLLAKALSKLRQSDRAYRIGGDAFAVFLIETGGQSARTALERFQANVHEMLTGTTVSIGYATFDPSHADEALHAYADEALCEAKRRGRNTIVGFEEICETATVLSPRKTAAVRALVEQELMDIAFQPIWDMASNSVLGFEALARPRAHLELAGAGEAFDIAERIRYVLELDGLCVRKAFEAAIDLPKDAVIFVNITPAYFEHSSFDPHAFVAYAKSMGVQADHIVVELTERRISDPNRLAARIAGLNVLGVRIALDDTGSGNAGLEILSKLQFDFVKIDRILFTHAVNDKSARGVLAGIIAIARMTGSYLIAEGIETPELLAFMHEQHGAVAGGGCVQGAQGYLLGMPQTAPIDPALLQQYRIYLATHNPKRKHINVA
jgi:diguanylate cyclase (GGDEF)-like protein